MKQGILFVTLCIFGQLSALAQPGKKTFSRSDTLFGTNTPRRSWWNVQRYDINVTPDFSSKTINGRTTITYAVIADNHDEYLQLDLKKPLQIDSLYFNGNIYVNDPKKPYYNEGNHWFIPLPKTPKGSEQSLTVVYHGEPKEAESPPWDGGWVWKKDGKGRPWISVACEDDGASVWYPCKDLWSDEPDKGASLTVTVPDPVIVVGNGRLKKKAANNGKTAFTWEVTAPINAYNIIPYIGYYTSWSDTLAGKNGNLDLTFWSLDYEVDKAKKQFEQVKPTLHAFEHWFGPYPFYEDGYQLVQAPYLGMEHQSAVAYGNEFRNGYLGTDMSGTGWGLKWDYIIVHETGHEWFGNSITAKDPADMWIQEAFTTYSETLFTEMQYGKKAANEYTQGLRRSITNDEPIIGPYGIHRAGSVDMYAKGANLVHTIRQIMNDDNRFWRMLQGLNKTFYRQTVTSKQVEDYLSRESGKTLTKIFDQYLRTTKVPVLEYRKNGNNVQYRWMNTVASFAMPVRLANGGWLKPKATWQEHRLKAGESFAVDKNFYINLRKL